MSDIRIKEAFATAAYFFLITLLLAFIGAKFPPMAKDISELMQEHIAGKTIKVFSILTFFLAFSCATRNVLRPTKYGKYIKFLIIEPSNFIITLAFVAAGMNWAVAVSSPFLFPDVVDREITLQLIFNSLQITGIAVGVGVTAWFLHSSPDSNKKSAPSEYFYFWLLYVASLISCATIFITIAFNIATA